MKTILTLKNLIIDSKNDEERLQQCDPGQDLFQNQKKLL